MRAVGIDISHWQGTFKNKGNIDFVIVKATEGWGWVDPEFENFLAEVKKVPIRGALHYFRTEYDPLAQAENLLEAISGKGFHEIIMDYEPENNVLDEAGARHLWQFYQALLSKTELPISLYTTEYIFRDYLLAHNPRWIEVPLHVARYQSGLDPQTDDPLFLNIPGLIWLRWQHTKTGKGGDYGVGSKYVDLNVFNGTVKKMQTFIKEFEMKKFYTSKTLWFNVIGVLFLWILPAIFPDFILAVPAEWQAFREPVILIVNLILRVFTNKGIEA